LNVQIQKHPNVKIVQLADKSTATILGSVESPIIFENNTHLVTGNILPNLCTYLILGLDSLYKMGLVIDTADHTWYYQMCPEEIYQFENKEYVGNTITIMRTIGGLSQLATLQILTEGERDKLNEFLRLELPLFETLSGRKKITEHVTLETTNQLSSVIIQ
jgi:hypothetical protein